jgi:putative DNA methylase
MPQEVMTRRRLPHWYVPGAAHFVTYRLAGSIPEAVLWELRAHCQEQLKQPCPDGLSHSQLRGRVHKQSFARYDRFLDHNRAIDWLARPAVAAVVRQNLYHHDGGKYHLMAWCIMPNHVHVLLQPLETQALAQEPPENAGEERPDADSPLAGIMHSLKSYTANRANQLLGRSGPFWQHESYDHWVRDEDELERVVDYIAYNPVKAGLVREPQEWFFGSAHDRYLREGIISGWLPADES